MHNTQQNLKQQGGCALDENMNYGKFVNNTLLPTKSYFSWAFSFINRYDASESKANKNSRNKKWMHSRTAVGAIHSRTGASFGDLHCKKSVLQQIRTVQEANPCRAGPHTPPVSSSCGRGSGSVEACK